MLTAEQQAARVGKITGSRIATIATGTEADMVKLWEIMTGRRDEDDLSGVWPVFLGTHTEQLHLDWLEHVWGEPIIRRGEFAQRSENEWAGATLDGWRASTGCPVELKHVGGWEPRETIIQRYFPQCQWQAYVTGALGTYFSVIEGAREPSPIYLPRDDDYLFALLDRAAAFMACVDADEPPFATEPPMVATLPSEWRTLDLDALEAAGEPLPNWSGDMRTALDEWLVTNDAAKRNAKATKQVKDLLPENVGLVKAGAIQVSRAKNGAVSIRGTR